MITKFKIYEDHPHGENINKFFFRKSNDVKYGNIFLLKETNVNWSSKSDYSLEGLNLAYNKLTNYHRYYKIVEEKRLQYSNSFYQNLELLTANELFDINPELFINFYNIINIRLRESGTKRPSEFKVRRNLRLLKSLMETVEDDIKMYLDSKKFNL